MRKILWQIMPDKLFRRTTFDIVNHTVYNIIGEKYMGIAEPLKL